MAVFFLCKNKLLTLEGLLRNRYLRNRYLSSAGRDACELELYLLQAFDYLNVDRLLLSRCQPNNMRVDEM